MSETLTSQPFVSMTPFPSMTFGDALELAKQGRLIARRNWNGLNMFVFSRPKAVLEVSIVKSLPAQVTAFFESRGISSVEFSSYLCIKTADNRILNGWLASQDDIMATDWYVLD